MSETKYLKDEMRILVDLVDQENLSVKGKIAISRINQMYNEAYIKVTELEDYYKNKEAEYVHEMNENHKLLEENKNLKASNERLSRQRTYIRELEEENKFLHKKIKVLEG